MIAFNSTTALIARASYGSGESRSYTHRTAEIAVAISSRTTSTSLNCLRNFCHAGTGRSAANRLGPYCSSLARASRFDRPREESLPRAATTSIASLWYSGVIVKPLLSWRLKVTPCFGAGL